MPVNPAAPLPANDQTDMTALLLAAAVHILLVGALFFSVQWRSQAPTAVAVEVWRSGPAPLLTMRGGGSGSPLNTRTSLRQPGSERLL